MAKPKMSMTMANNASGIPDDRHAIAASYGLKPLMKEDGRTTWKQYLWVDRDGGEERIKVPIYYDPDDNKDTGYYVIVDGVRYRLKDIPNHYSRKEHPKVWTDGDLPAVEQLTVNLFKEWYGSHR